MFYTVFQIVIDERNTLEIPATDLTFLCPERQWVMKNAEDRILKEKNIYVYQVKFFCDKRICKRFSSPTLCQPIFVKSVAVVVLVHTHAASTRSLVMLPI